MNLEEFSNKADLNKLPELVVKMLWTVDWYDGPLEGICSYDGAEHHFHIIDDIPNRGRLLAVLKTTAEQQQLERERHTLFQKYVGHHCDFDDEGNRTGKLDGEDMDKFYKMKEEWEDIDWSENEVVGYFSGESFDHLAFI